MHNPTLHHLSCPVDAYTHMTPLHKHAATLHGTPQGTIGSQVLVQDRWHDHRIVPAATKHAVQIIVAVPLSAMCGLQGLDSHCAMQVPWLQA